MFETARFVELVTWMRKILNIKSPDAARNLIDADRERFSSENNLRLDFLLRIDTFFKIMDSSKRGFCVRI